VKLPFLLIFSQIGVVLVKLAPILKEVKSELGDGIKIIKIDVDKNEKLAAKYQVRGVPTMIIFKGGEQKWRQSGVLQKQDLVEIIKSHS
jgi:thioredoxin 1